MKNPKVWLSFILFLLVFGMVFGVAGFVLIVMFDYVFRMLFPYAVLASCIFLFTAGLVGLASDLILANSPSGRTRWLNRRATLHSLVYSVEMGSHQRRTRGAWNNV